MTDQAAATADVMEERDPRLMAGEDIVFKTEKHWFAPIRASLMAVLLVLGALILAWLQTEQTTGIMGFVNRVLNLVEVALMLGGIGWIIYNIIAWRTASFVVTNHRILCSDGLLRKREADTLLSSVSDVKSRQSAVGKALNFGDIQILGSSGDAGADKFTTVKDADGFKKAILEQKLKEAGVAGTAGTGATATAASASAAGQSAQAAAVATLNQLAQLRDSGAITPQEFEAKKAELLARI
jgi:hypothetical protein